MKKNLTKIMAMMLLVVICAGILAGCGSKGPRTLTNTPDPVDVAGNSQHSAFLADAVPSQVNTLILNADGTYSLEKKVDEENIHLDIVFYGKYTESKDVVTLAVPDDVAWDLDWAQFIEMEYFPGVIKGQLSKGDTKIDCTRNSFNYIGGGHDPLYMFMTPYFLDSEATGEVQVTLNKDNTFTYIEAASSEDD